MFTRLSFKAVARAAALNFASSALVATDFSAVSQSFRDAARLLGLAPQLGLANDNEHNTQQVENAA